MDEIGASSNEADEPGQKASIVNNLFNIWKIKEWWIVMSTIFLYILESGFFTDISGAFLLIFV